MQLSFYYIQKNPLQHFIVLSTSTFESFNQLFIKGKGLEILKSLLLIKTLHRMNSHFFILCVNVAIVYQHVYLEVRGQSVKYILSM